MLDIHLLIWTAGALHVIVHRVEDERRGNCVHYAVYALFEDYEQGGVPVQIHYEVIAYDNKDEADSEPVEKVKDDYISVFSAQKRDEHCFCGADDYCVRVVPESIGV